MLGRYGEGEAQPQQLLDRRQVAAVAVTILSIAAGLVVEYVLHGSRMVYTPLYAVGLVVLGGPIVVSAVRGLLKGHTNVDELVALALIASALGGYFLEASVVALLMVLGSLFEQRASLKARRAIESLLRLAPEEAVLVHDDGREEVVPADSLKPGDRALVRTAMRVPADGVIESGGANFDQSAVTGESVPVYRKPGETVFGSTLALDGSVAMRVTKTGEDSTVGRIIKIVREAEHYQAPVMRIADQWAKYYTPLILAVAALTFGGWWFIHSGAPGALHGAWTATVAVLVVGCPCTIVLATPTAIIAAMGRSAKLGMLIKTGRVLERAALVDTLIFDKTGTLTSGQHEVVAVVPADDLKGMGEVVGLCPAVEHSILRLTSATPPSPGTPGEGRGEGSLAYVDDARLQRNPHPNPLPSEWERGQEDARGRLLALAAAVEYHSNHPFARAIRIAAQEQDVTFTPASDVKEIPGVGVQGRVKGQPVLVGRPEFVAHSIRNACAVPGTMIRPISRYSVIAVEVAGTYAGLILLRDRMRESAEAVIEQLRESGLTNLAVLSGDHRGAVKLVADQLKLDGAYSGLLPADKALQVKALKEQGHVVAFVGDGMNDAPALAVADVGIAMGGTGTDLALQSADVVLLNDRLDRIATLFDLSRQVRKTIHVNLALGLALNVVALALASVGILSPMLGALWHNLGSVFVVGNSARFATFGTKVANGSARAISTTEAPVTQRAA
jgi:cation transport ATPase